MMHYATGRTLKAFQKAAEHFGTSIEVFVADYFAMPYPNTYFVYESWTDAVYVWDKLINKLESDELTALAVHEVSHAVNARFHQRLMMFHKWLRKTMWWGWKRFQKRVNAADAERERGAEVHAAEATSFVAWARAVHKANMLVPDEEICRRYHKRLRYRMFFAK